MSPGKLAAQVAHAAVEAARVTPQSILDEWNSGGHYMKVVLGAEDEAQMTNIQTYLEERKFRVIPIIDEGRTEIKPFSKTALGIAVVDKADQHVIDTFSAFKLYRDWGYHVYSVPDIDETDAINRVPYKYLNRQGRKILQISRTNYGK